MPSIENNQLNRVGKYKRWIAGIVPAVALITGLWWANGNVRLGNSDILFIGPTRNPSYGIQWGYDTSHIPGNRLWGLSLMLHIMTYENLCQKGEADRRVFVHTFQVALVLNSEGFTGEKKNLPTDVFTDSCKAVNN